MTAPRMPYTPLQMNAELAATLTADGFNLPESFPFPARVAPDMNSAHGWTVRTIGSGMRKDADEGAVVYVAPDGAQFCRATHGARPVLVGLSKRTSALPLRVLPGTRRPAWVIADTPRGEIPEHLRRYLLKPGQKLAKGEKRVAEELAMEPEQAPRGRAKLSDDALRSLVKAQMDMDPKAGLTAVLLRLRHAGHSASGGRVRAMYRELAAQAVAARRHTTPARAHRAVGRKGGRK